MKSVILVDDHSIFREGLALILSGRGGYRVAGEAESGAAALALLAKTRCDALVVDLSLPDMNGVELIRRVRDTHPRLPVLVLSMHREEQFVLHALRAGASGYLTKDTASAGLVGALDKVIAGGKYLSPELAERVALELAGSDGGALPHEALSPREAEVFRLLVRGAPVKEIAAKLQVSSKTVSTHRARILEKMAMKSNADLVRYAVNQRLL